MGELPCSRILETDTTRATTNWIQKISSEVIDCHWQNGRIRKQQASNNINNTVGMYEHNRSDPSKRGALEMSNKQSEQGDWI